MIFTNGIRGFGYGFIAVIAVVYLRFIGLNALTVGLLLSASSIRNSLVNLVVSKYTDRIGRRISLIAFASIGLISTVVLFLTSDPTVAALFFVVGGVADAGSGVGPYRSVEQATLPDTTTRENRNNLFSTYNVSNTLFSAAGSLFAGAQGQFQGFFHLQTLDSYRIYFAGYAIVAILLITLYSGLSRRIELRRGDDDRDKARTKPDPRFGSREFRSKYSVIAKLSGLIAMDQFGSGFWGQSLLTLLFTSHFNASVGELGVVFFATTMLQAASFPLGAWIATRIGMINEMVFTQIPTNLLMMLVGLAPNFPLAIAFFLARAPFSMMDTPVTQAYIVSIVPPELRTPASAITNVTKDTARSLSPPVAAYLTGTAGLFAVPFILGASVKFVYDALLYYGFRHQREQ